MMDALLNQRLEAYAARGLRRQLPHMQAGMLDFCSNDYLGFARSAELAARTARLLEAQGFVGNGATGSRLISGNSALFEEIEQEIAHFHRAQAGLVFNSGYAANAGLLACVARKGDTLITDELVHASMIDGARLSYAQRYIFRHNDLDDLRSKLLQARGNVFIAVESVYSMNGDLAPLRELQALAREFGAGLIVDEAHAVGVFGPAGAGRVVELGLEKEVFARVYTFGKALGHHGAIVVGSHSLRTYLINFARTFIYTTALPLPALLAVQAAYHYLQQHPGLQQRLAQRIRYFRHRLLPHFPGQWLPSSCCIQSLLLPGNQAAKELSSHLMQAGIFVKAILSPTVPAGTERMRFCVHLFNDQAQIDRLAACLSGKQLAHYR